MANMNMIVPHALIKALTHSLNDPSFPKHNAALRRYARRCRPRLRAQLLGLSDACNRSRNVHRRLRAA
jgi:hypothetical protein